MYMYMYPYYSIFNTIWLRVFDHAIWPAFGRLKKALLIQRQILFYYEIVDDVVRYHQSIIEQQCNKFALQQPSTIIKFAAQLGICSIQR